MMMSDAMASLKTRPKSTEHQSEVESIQARERSTNSNVWVRISFGGLGIFRVKGWGSKSLVWPSKPRELSVLGAGDSAICGRLAAPILRLQPAGLRFGELRPPQLYRGGLGLRFSNRSGLRPAAI